MENSNYLEHLTPDGYDLGKRFDVSLFDEGRISEIRTVIRKFYRARPSINAEFYARRMADDISAYLGGERKHTGAVHGDVRTGELIYAMVLEGYMSQRCSIRDAHFNISTISARALALVAYRDLDGRSRCNVVRALDYLDIVDPGHREWYGLECINDRNFEIRRIGGFENYYTDEEREKRKGPALIGEAEIRAEDKTLRPVIGAMKCRCRLGWKGKVVLIISCVLILMAGAVCYVGCHQTRRADSLAILPDGDSCRASELLSGIEDRGLIEEDLWPDEADNLYESKRELYRDKSIERMCGLYEYDEYHSEADSCLRIPFVPQNEGMTRELPYWMRNVINDLRGFSDRDFAIVLAALLFALGAIFYLTFLFKRVRPRTNITVCREDREERPDEKAEEKKRYDALVDALKNEDAIIYGDRAYLENVRTLLDSVCPNENVQILYFDPSDISNSSPIPVINENSCRTYADAYALAGRLVAALRPYAKSDIARNEFFYTSTLTLLAEILEQLFGWKSGRERTFAHVVELAMREHRSLLRFFNSRPSSESRIRFTYETFIGNAADQYYGQISDLQLTLAPFYEMDVLEAFRPLGLDDNLRTIMFVDDSDNVKLRIFKPLLDVLAEGFLNSRHRPMAIPERIDFEKAPFAIKGNRKVDFDGRYYGMRQPLVVKTGCLDSIMMDAEHDIDEIMPKSSSKYPEKESAEDETMMFDPFIEPNEDSI